LYFIAVKNQELRQEIEDTLREQSHDFCSIDFDKNRTNEHISRCFTAPESTLIMEWPYPGKPVSESKRILRLLCQRLPTYLIELKPDGSLDGLSTTDAINQCTRIGSSDALRAALQTVPFPVRPVDKVDISYFHQTLAEENSLSIISLQVKNFYQIEQHYDREVVEVAKKSFRKTLQTMWSQPAGFRRGDRLVTIDGRPDCYYLILRNSKKENRIHSPGNTESIADRIYATVERTYIQKLSKDCAEQGFKYVGQVFVPEIEVGFGSAVHNPVVNSNETVKRVLETTHRNAAVNLQRTLEREREFFHMIFQNPTTLYPHIQGVFHCNENSQAQLIGFESLIRFDLQRLIQILPDLNQSLINMKIISPEFLFKKAKALGLEQELDQLCLRRAFEECSDIKLPLFLNVLPANLRHFDTLMKHLPNPPKHGIILEVSENAAITNLEKIQSIRKKLTGKGVRLAADDFGKAHSGLERIMALSPDIIKLDRELIREIDKHDLKKIYLEGLINAAHKCDTKVLAEGVETKAELSVLQGLGIDFYQGYLFHRPASLISVKQKFPYAFEDKTSSKGVTEQIADENDQSNSEENIKHFTKTSKAS